MLPSKASAGSVQPAGPKNAPNVAEGSSLLDRVSTTDTDSPILPLFAKVPTIDKTDKRIAAPVATRSEGVRVELPNNSMEVDSEPIPSPVLGSESMAIDVAITEEVPLDPQEKRAFDNANANESDSAATESEPSPHNTPSAAVEVALPLAMVPVVPSSVALLPGERSAFVQPPKWLLPDEVPSSSFDTVIPPKATDSDLCQRIYQIIIILLNSFPRMKKIPASLAEFIARATTDEAIYEDPVEATEMLHGRFYCALPITSFSVMVSSQDLVAKLGITGGFKKNHPMLFGDNMPTKDRFWVVHHNGRNGSALNDSTYAENVSMIKHFQSLEKKMITFFQGQFDDMHSEESSSIKKGLQNECDTLYVIGFDNNKQFHIVAAIQYVAMIDGIYVNWLAVANQVTERSHPFPKHANETERLTHFRRIGLATFLQELVLLIQSGRGWQPHMFLQTNINTRACRYYVKRGYQQAPENNLDCLSFLPAGSFASLPIYFITDATQIQDGTPAKDHLKLHYHLGHMQSSFLEPAISSILPSAEDEPLLEFPFNCNAAVCWTVSQIESKYICFRNPCLVPRVGHCTQHVTHPTLSLIPKFSAKTECLIRCMTHLLSHCRITR